MEAHFKGKKVLVTGASRGLGRAIAALFVREGAEVMGLASDRAKLEAVAASLGSSFQYFVADLAKTGFETAVAERLGKVWGRLDMLVNNAAIHGHMGGLATGDPAEFDKVIQVNVLAPHHLIQAMLPYLKKTKEPRVINVTSEAGRMSEVAGRDDKQSYRFSKWSLNGLTMAWAAQLKGKVAVNCICPGWVRTDMGGADADQEPEHAAAAILDLARADFEQSGKFIKKGKIINF